MESVKIKEISNSNVILQANGDAITDITFESSLYQIKQAFENICKTLKVQPKGIKIRNTAANAVYCLTKTKPFLVLTQLFLCHIFNLT